MARSSILECVDLLLERDYPEIAVFDGSRNGMVGPIFIPESYLPKKPSVVDPDIAEEIKEQFPNDKKLQGDIKQTEGDLLEQQVYDTLKKHFYSKVDEVVLVLQGFELVKLKGEKGSNVRELDFLVINFTHQYILKPSITHQII